MKKLLPVFFLFALACAVKEQKKGEIVIQEAGWKFQVPDHFSFGDSAFDKKGRLTKKIQDHGPALKLFSTNTGWGSFAAYIWKDTLNGHEWQSYYDRDTEWYFSQLRELEDMTVLQTEYSRQKLGNTDFLVQYISYIKKNVKDTGYIYHYLGRVNKNSLDISLEYYGKQKGKLFHDIVNSSSFAEQ